MCERMTSPAVAAGGLGVYLAMKTSLFFAHFFQQSFFPNLNQKYYKKPVL
ncbi:hypothetical protein GS8_955 [Geobacillus stearothermophilus]|uniref:Uncharacterized protein n=2 Tax=Geobacillus stearothermophilus TaxID=1422 RepID=A0ABQ7HGP3_GEOSE|nr:hypothetical protein GS8_955 [Geobacillus stearothermophilus]